MNEIFNDDPKILRSKSYPKLKLTNPRAREEAAPPAVEAAAPHVHRGVDQQNRHFVLLVNKVSKKNSKEACFPS